MIRVPRITGFPSITFGSMLIRSVTVTSTASAAP